VRAALDTVPHAIMARWRKLGMESMYVSDEGGPGRGAISSVSMMTGLGSPGGGVECFANCKHNGGIGEESIVCSTECIQFSGDVGRFRG
jgi:hypothetical protein